MSTVSASLNGAATLTLTDFYARFFRPNASERERMGVLYVSSFIWGILGILCALAMIRAKGILDAYWVLAGIFSGGIVGIFLLGIFTKIANSRGALIGMLVGLVVIIWMTASYYDCLPGSLAEYRCPWHSYMINVVGTVLVLLIGMAASALFKGKPKPAAVGTGGTSGVTGVTGVTGTAEAAGTAGNEKIEENR